MGKLYVSEHPLIRHKLGIVRDKETCEKEFRELISEISMLLCYEAARDLPLEKADIVTPVAPTQISRVSRGIVLVPVLRAGIGMVEAILQLIPSASVGHVGFYRDPETLNPVDYFRKLPNGLPEKDCFVLDPMLATGGTAVAAIQFLKDKGAKNIKFLCVVACPEGVKAVGDAHPDVDIYAAALDSGLNDHGYIVPGLGDAGDRQFGTN